MRFLFFATILFPLLSLANLTPIQRETKKLRAANKGPILVRKGYVVVPVYREFWNGNIGGLLASLARQEPTEPPVETHLVAVVNNLVGAPDDTRKENQETVGFLRKLQRGETPDVPIDAYELREGIESYLAHPFPIHVLDYTDPGLPVYGHWGIPRPDMGKIRDLGNQFALAQIEAPDLATTFIMQTDADSLLPPDGVQIIQSVFSHERYAYGIFDLDFTIERGSEPRLFQRLIFDRCHLGTQFFNSGAAIVARASSIKKIGGVPSAVNNEDGTLVARLEAQFPSQKAFLFENHVLTKYRGRREGYRARDFLESQDEPLEFSFLTQHALRRLSFVRTDLRRGSLPLSDLFEKEVAALLANWRSEVVETRNLAGQFLTQVADSQDTVAPPDLRRHRFLGSPWITEYFRQYLNRANGKPDTALHLLSKDFPDFLQDPPPFEVQQLFSLQAMKRLETFRVQFPNWSGRNEGESCISHLQNPSLITGSSSE
jgi:hypothetical protein